jgi:hypothetical protein
MDRHDSQKPTSKLAARGFLHLHMQVKEAIALTDARPLLAVPERRIVRLDRPEISAG